jgi:hypothetical protein
VVYTTHDYALPGFVDGGPYPGISRGQHVDRDFLERTFLERTRYMRETGTPIWVGEFGPVYTGVADQDAMRRRLLEDQLEIYRRYDASWAIWTYKDIGLQGVTYAAPDSAWLTRIRPIVEKKARLGVDAWGSVDRAIRELMDPIERTVAKEFPSYHPFPFGAQRHINQLVRHMLLAEPLVDEFANLFQGVSDKEIDALMASFLFENCVRRSELASVLAGAAVA